MSNYTENYNQFLTVNSLPDKGDINPDTPLEGSRLNVIRGEQGIQSLDYEPGVSGWKIFGNGNAEFNDGQFRGALSAATINIPNSTSPLFSVDTSGNVSANSLKRNDFHWFTLFESIDGYAKTATGTGTIICNPSSVDLNLGSLNNNVIEIQKVSDYYPEFSWDEKRKIKISLSFFSFVGNAQTLSFGTGSHISSINNNKIGFYISNYTLYAITANGSSYTLSEYGTISNGTTYTLEAEYIPGVSAKFYLNGTIFATITTTLPSGLNYSATPIEIYFKNNENVSGKSVSIGLYDFWQAN